MVSQIAESGSGEWCRRCARRRTKRPPRRPATLIEPSSSSGRRRRAARRRALSGRVLATVAARSARSWAQVTAGAGARPEGRCEDARAPCRCGRPARGGRRPRPPGRWPAGSRRGRTPGGSFSRVVCSMTRGPRERDQRAGLGVGHVAQRGERRPDAAGRGVHQHHDHRQLGVVHQLEGDHALGHLHQGDDALLHARAARGGDDHQRQPALDAAVAGAHQLLADHRPHAAAEVGEVHDRRDGGVSLDLELGHDQRLGGAGGLGGLDAIRVGLQVDELERVARPELGPQLLPGPAAGELVEPLARAHREVVAAGRADAHVGAHLLRPIVALAAGTGALVRRELALLGRLLGALAQEAIDRDRDGALGHLADDYVRGSSTRASQSSTLAR